MASVSKQYNVHLLEKLLFVKFPLQVQYSVRKLASPKGEKNKSWDSVYLVRGDW